MSSLFAFVVVLLRIFLFSQGGTHIGFNEEGFSTVCAVEINKDAVKTYKKNNPDIPVYRGDIEKFLAKLEQDETYNKTCGRVDIVHASCPGQGFSKANRGKKPGKNDEANNQLSLVFPQILETTKPLVGIFENVDGMWSKKGMSILKKIIIECIALGYQVRHKVLRACDYGDPQIRARSVLIVAKSFVDMPDHPVPTHGNKKKNLKQFVCSKDALDVLTKPEFGPFPNQEKYSQSKQTDILTLNPNKFAPVVMASGNIVKHYAENRCITVREAATLQSFPLHYEFEGSLTEQMRQVGDASPVEFTRAIAQAVRGCLRYRYLEEEEPDAINGGGIGPKPTDFYEPDGKDAKKKSSKKRKKKASARSSKRSKK